MAGKAGGSKQLRRGHDFIPNEEDGHRSCHLMISSGTSHKYQHLNNPRRHCVRALSSSICYNQSRESFATVSGNSKRRIRYKENEA